jgi:cytochrome c oxidase subunit 3
MRQSNLNDDHKGYKSALLMTSVLGLAFTGFQLLGWAELFRSGVGFRNNISGTYLYLLSGLHLAHLLVGVGILFYFLFKAYMTEADAFKSLMFDTDPVEKLKIEMMGVYWHFVDGLWLFLYVCFLVALYLMPASMDGWFTRPF